MVSYISNPASISLKGLNRLRGQQKAKERPENGQGKAKEKHCHLTVKPEEDPGFSELYRKLGSPLYLVTACILSAQFLQPIRQGIQASP